jgi:hypothetical protein
MITRRALLAGTGALLAAGPALATNASGVRIGVHRWDAWYDPTPLGTYWYSQHNLDVAQYQARAPMWATQLGPNRMSIVASQAAMDAEIAAATTAGVHYWIFAYDISGDSVQIAFNLFRASAAYASMKWAFRCSINQDFLNSMTNGTMLAFMQQANYEKFGTRPILYINVSTLIAPGDPLAAEIAAFRAVCTAAGLGTPYIVLLGSDAATAVATAANIGADCIGFYAYAHGAVTFGTYPALDTLVQAYWATLPALLSGGIGLQPPGMAGWDRRPRIERPVPSEVPGQQPIFGMSNSYAAATPSQLAAHVQALINFVATNPSACPSGRATLYAWNEFDEGGWICPTWTAGGADHSRLDALAAVW